MKIKEIASSSKQLEELQSASKPLSPEQARVRAMKQGIDRQKLALAESVSASKTLNMLKKCRRCTTSLWGFDYCWR